MERNLTEKKEIITQIEQLAALLKTKVVSSTGINDVRLDLYIAADLREDDLFLVGEHPDWNEGSRNFYITFADEAAVEWLTEHTGETDIYSVYIANATPEEPEITDLTDRLPELIRRAESRHRTGA